MAKYALCIGINNYPGTASDLAGCVNDVDDWAAALEERLPTQPELELFVQSLRGGARGLVR